MANPESRVFGRLFKRDLILALDKLPDDFKLTVVLADLVGFSYKEISSITGSPIGTVMSRLHRGRRLLREELVTYREAA